MSMTAACQQHHAERCLCVSVCVYLPLRSSTSQCERLFLEMARKTDGRNIGGYLSPPSGWIRLPETGQQI